MNKLLARELLVEFYNPADDKLAKAHIDDTRRPRLTMMHLQKLRKSKDARQYDNAVHMEHLPDMYSEVDDQGMM